MTQIRIHDVLNKLLAIHSRSFAMYLVDAHRWARSGQETILEVLQQIVTDQRVMIDRIARFLLRDGVVPDVGQFPMEFTASNDLSLDFLLRAAIRHQEADIAAIAECVEAVTEAPAARALAEEALGLARGHLENLRELAASNVPVPAR